MSCFNSGNSCIWIILLILLLSNCCGNNNNICSNNGCNDNCGSCC